MKTDFNKLLFSEIEKREKLISEIIEKTKDFKSKHIGCGVKI